MLGTYGIVYDQPKYGERVKGLALPIFIHNGTYFLDTLDIYADGVADAWELIPIPSLQAKIDSGWITTAPPIGGSISIHDLGGGTLSAVEWDMPSTKLASTAQALFRQLNPDQRDLFDFDERRRQLAAEWEIPESQVGLSRMRQNKGAYRRGENGEEIAGATFPLFWSTPSGIYLTECFMYADGLLSVTSGTMLYTVDEFRPIFEADYVLTSVDDGVWVTVPGLGRFQVTDTYWYVEKEELGKNILNGLNVLRGGPDVIKVCYQAFVAYQNDPTDANREILRAAYEAVPAHHRMYTQRDQDAKDHTIRRILRERNQV
jgi:hypothetical protein